MKDGWMYIYKEKNQIWIDGIKKKKYPAWANRVPATFEGWTEAMGGKMNLYTPDWQKVKTFKIPA